MVNKAKEETDTDSQLVSISSGNHSTTTPTVIYLKHNGPTSVLSIPLFTSASPQNQVIILTGMPPFGHMDLHVPPPPSSTCLTAQPQLLPVDAK